VRITVVLSLFEILLSLVASFHLPSYLLEDKVIYFIPFVFIETSREFMAQWKKKQSSRRITLNWQVHITSCKQHETWKKVEH
jgi:hypothetical protein